MIEEQNLLIIEGIVADIGRTEGMSGVVKMWGLRRRNQKQGDETKCENVAGVVVAKMVGIEEREILSRGEFMILS